MSPQVLDRTLTSYRIGDPAGAYPIFDATGSYRAAFVNGLAWNAVNVAIVLWLIHCRRARTSPAAL